MNYHFSLLVILILVKTYLWNQMLLNSNACDEGFRYPLSSLWNNVFNLFFSVIFEFFLQMFIHSVNSLIRRMMCNWNIKDCSYCIKKLCKQVLYTRWLPIPEHPFLWMFVYLLYSQPALFDSLYWFPSWNHCLISAISSKIICKKLLNICLFIYHDILQPT